jgi:integrase/recombinase XerC
LHGVQEVGGSNPLAPTIRLKSLKNAITSADVVAFFMSTSKANQKSTLTSPALLDAYTDFILSRQAMNAAKTTIDFYKFTVGKFLEWAEKQRGVKNPEEVTGRIVREYIAELATKGKSDTTVWNNARAIKTMFLFWHAEGYVQAVVRFEMPKLTKKRLPVLDAEELMQVIKTCNVRDKAVVLFMADSGLRRAEICALNWDDVDLQNGLVRVKQGKGRKDRSAVIGATTRRALLAYRRTLKNREGILFQTKSGTRFTGSGLLCIFRRLRKATGIHVTPHAMRRTFVILSLRAGMDVLHLQTILGHESLEMTRHYASMVDEDLVREHKAHSPIDSLR